MVGRPDLPMPSAASRNINDTPFFCRTPPWHKMQFGFKIGLISRLKSTGLRKNRENRGAARDQLAHISPTAPSEMATIPRRRERNANLVSIDKGLDTLLVISGSPSKKSSTNFRFGPLPRASYAPPACTHRICHQSRALARSAGFQRLVSVV